MIKKILFPVYLVGCVCLMAFFTVNTSHAQLTTPCPSGESATVSCKDQQTPTGTHSARLCSTCDWGEYGPGATTGECTFCI